MRHSRALCCSTGDSTALLTIAIAIESVQSSSPDRIRTCTSRINSALPYRLGDGRMSRANRIRTGTIRFERAGTLPISLWLQGCP